MLDNSACHRARHSLARSTPANSPASNSVVATTKSAPQIDVERGGPQPGARGVLKDGEGAAPLTPECQSLAQPINEPPADSNSPGPASPRTLANPQSIP